MSTTCLPNDGQTVDICPTQVRLGKDIYNICSPQGIERLQDGAGVELTNC